MMRVLNFMFMSLKVYSNMYQNEIINFKGTIAASLIAFILVTVVMSQSLLEFCSCKITCVVIYTIMMVIMI